MAAAAAAEKIEETPEPADSPDVSALHDALYEVVSLGVGPELPLDEIQAFIHEHARQPKSQVEFMAFFETHALPLPDENGDIKAPTRSELSMSFPRVPDGPTPLSLDVVRELADETDPHIEVVAETQPPPPSKAAALAPWAVLSVVIALCGAGAWWGYQTLTGLQGELRAAEQRADQNQRVIEKLEDRSHALEDRAAGIQSSVAANGQLIQRMDQKSDLLLERLPEKKKPRRWVRKRTPQPSAATP